MSEQNQEIQEVGQGPGQAGILPQKSYTSDEVVQLVSQLKLENEISRLKDSQKQFVTRDELRDELEKLTDKLTDKLTETFNAKFDGLKADIAAVKSDVADVKSDVAAVKADVADLKSEVVRINIDLGQFGPRLDSVEKSVSLLTKIFTFTAAAFVAVFIVYGAILFNVWGAVSSLKGARAQEAQQVAMAQTDPAEPATPSQQATAPPAPSAETVVQSDRAGGPYGTEGSEGGG
ncbi:MAG: hypothetical protein LBQ12_07890 [Deltaproteobacteria bacterium]|jgi:hypothetical protein|nr:hypothetical protein [Deltaproteobacteria bacterium]